MRPVRFLSSVAVGCTAIVGAALAPAVASAQPAASCTGIFSGSVTRGPDLGFVLEGTITLPAGHHQHLHSELIEANGTTVPVTGSEDGRSIQLVFHLPQGTLRGSGRMPSSAGACTGNFGGSFKGPRHHDRGDWGIIWGS